MRVKPTNDFTVSPVVVAVDTREQFSYDFGGIRADRGGSLIIRTVRKTLETGDYSIVGRENEITVERKSKDDAWGTFGQGRERFERELERMAAMRFSAVVVECELSELLIPPLGRRLSPKSVYRSIIAWQQRYPAIHWWLCPGRDVAEKTTFRILEMWHRGTEKDCAHATSRAQELTG